MKYNKFDSKLDCNFFLGIGGSQGHLVRPRIFALYRDHTARKRTENYMVGEWQIHGFGDTTQIGT